jgi:AGZA family xanthine/uracil permease-like MFS transporter
MNRMRTEALAGVTTFFTMAYIIVVNPSILSTPGTGMPFDGVLAATVLLCFLMTLLMGLYAKLPFAVAPGMGLNAFFTFSLVLGHKIPWPTALGMVFWSGVLFILASATNVRVLIAEAIPSGLRHATATGIGVFLTFIGLKNAGLVQADPVTLVRAGDLNAQSLLSVAGLVIAVVLVRRRNPFAFLAAIFAVTLGAGLLGQVHLPESLLSKPDFHSVLFKLDILGALKPALLPAIVSIFLTDLFDSLSTFVGVSQATGLVDERGRPRRLKEGLLVDAIATLSGGLLGTSPGTAYIESAAGIEVGGRTGLTAVFAALCFLPCLFLAPLAGMVPAYATAPVLILVGALMFRSVTALNLSAAEDVVPAFLTIVLIPLTFSITRGILWGFVTHVILYALAGRRRELSPMMVVLAVVSAGLMALESWT